MEMNEVICSKLSKSSAFLPSGGHPCHPCWLPGSVFRGERCRSKGGCPKQLQDIAIALWSMVFKSNTYGCIMMYNVYGRYFCFLTRHAASVDDCCSAFLMTEPGGVQVQVRDTGHWVEFVGLWLGVMKDPRMTSSE